MLTVSRMRIATPTLIRGAAYIFKLTSLRLPGPPVFSVQHWKTGCGLETRLPLLSVCAINNTEKTFSMFSREPSRSLTLSQHCTRHAQWATNMSMWACFTQPFSIHWYAVFSAMGKLNWAFVSNGRAVCSISTKQAFYSLKPPGKSYVPQVGVRLVRMAYFRFYNYPKIVFV